ncbi:hypothetical protein VPH35_003265 [Triticum aestivum]
MVARRHCASASASPRSSPAARPTLQSRDSMVYVYKGALPRPPPPLLRPPTHHHSTRALLLRECVEREREEEGRASSPFLAAHLPFAGPTASRMRSSAPAAA